MFQPMCSPVKGIKTPGFSCTVCGECCRDDQVIRLNGDDLELLCRFLGLPDAKALEDGGYIEYVHEEPGFERPRIKFRKGPFRFCPFLQNSLDDKGRLWGLCSLHPDFKPLVCLLSPLGRYVDDTTGCALETWEFILPVEGCPGEGAGDFDPQAALVPLRERLDRETAWMRGQIGKTKS